MGLVMQEPTLFNYSIKENILYGDSSAKNSDIRNAAVISNAIEFIEKTEEEKNEFNVIEIFKKAKALKSQIIRKIGKKTYSKLMNELKIMEEAYKRE